VDGQVGTLIEVLCESDFVAKNEKFTSFVTEAAQRAITDFSHDGDISETIARAESDNLTEMIGALGENMYMRRAVRWETKGRLKGYMHMGGKIGVLVDVEGDTDAETLKDISMHIAAFKPEFVSPDDIPEERIEKEKEIAAAQVSDKPAHIIDNIVNGKMQKWYSEVCLTKQPWLRDEKSCLEDVAPQARVQRFLRWEAGEEL